MAKFKIGDKLQCINVEGKTTNNNQIDALYGGHGWIDGKVFTVKEITSGSYPVYWHDGDGGIYEPFLIPADEENFNNAIAQIAKEFKNA